LPAATASNGVPDRYRIVMTRASALVPLWNRGLEWERRLAMVREARAFLYLSTFYIEHDDYGIGMLSELIAAQRRGVSVNLLVDGFGQRLGGVLMSAGQRATLAAMLDELQRAGTMVTTYHPARRLQRWLGGGQHVKIQVTEAGEAIFGSSNLSRSSYEGWNEYSVALRGPVVRRLLESYRAIGGTVDETHIRQLDAVSESRVADLELDYWVCNPNSSQGLMGPLGWRGDNVVTARLIERIATARRSICITSFYFKPVEPLLAALLAAARRGVRVEVHHSHREALPATDLAWLAAAAHYRRLLEAGVRIYENRHGEHSKPGWRLAATTSSMPPTTGWPKPCWPVPTTGPRNRRSASLRSCAGILTTSPSRRRSWLNGRPASLRGSGCSVHSRGGCDTAIQRGRTQVHRWRRVRSAGVPAGGGVAWPDQDQHRERAGPLFPDRRRPRPSISAAPSLRR
jgi:phosphatidylserine/phosphatidylglycerophosphate/cardiolipin synthase-like enzyme